MSRYCFSMMLGKVAMNQLLLRCNEMELPKGWTTAVVRDLEQVEAIRPVWEQMQRVEPLPVVNADIDRYISVLESMREAAKPHVMIFYYEGAPKSIAIARIEKQQMACRIGYWRVIKPSIRCLCVIYGGILGRPTNETSLVLVQSLMSSLSRGEADVVQFNHLRTDSPVFAAVRNLPCVLSRGWRPKIENHYRVAIPGSMDDFYRSCSKNCRKRLRRYIRNIEREYVGRMEVITYTSVHELDKAMKDAVQVSSKTYQYGLGSGLVNDVRTRELMTAAARKNWLRLDILYIDGEPCAFRSALKYGNTCFSDKIGYSPAWKEHNVGTILFLKVLESLCEDPAIDFLDFGFGGGQHKQWGQNQSWQEALVYIFAPRLYPVLINASQGVTMGVNACLEYVVNRMNLGDWMKRCWRHSLQAKKPKRRSLVGR